MGGHGHDHALALANWHRLALNLSNILKGYTLNCWDQCLYVAASFRTTGAWSEHCSDGAPARHILAVNHTSKPQSSSPLQPCTSAAAPSAIASSVPVPVGDSSDHLAGDMRMITPAISVPAAAAELLELPSMMPSGVELRGREIGAGAACILWFNLAFLKLSSSVISRCRACGFALPAAMVIAWH
jgi:hypothetical protein